MTDIVNSPQALPDPAAIHRAAACIRRGGVVIFPTTGLYGLGADARNPAAVAKVYRIKRRSPDKPLLVLIDTPADLLAIVKKILPPAAYYIDHFWPGGLTLVFELRDDDGDGLAALLTAGTGKIGVRLPAHPVARALVRAVGGPITATSANFADTPGAAAVADLPEEFVARADMVLDAGRLAGGPGSTVLDVSAARPVILREGAVSAQRLNVERWPE